MTPSTTDDHTLVFNDRSEEAPDDYHSASLRALLAQCVERDQRSLGEIATAARMSRRQLGRILAGEKPLRLVDLRWLTEVLMIDRARAVLAIEVIGDWRSYDDPGLCLMMHLVAPVVSKLIDRADFPIEPLTPTAVTRLSDWLANSIITNQTQIRNRRNEFIKLPDL